MATAIHGAGCKGKVLTRRLFLDILIQIGIVVAIYLAYSFSRGSLDHKAITAFGNAQDIIDLERDLGIFIERDIQSFFLETPLRIDIANYIYTLGYYPVLLLFAGWAYWCHREKYKFIGTVFIISAILAFLVFAFYPVAPPRFFSGFVDTIHTDWGVNESSVQRFYNPFAAMPSLHLGWSLMVGIGICWMTRAWYARALGIMLPIAMFIGITATGNHFVLDAIGGIAVIIVAFVLAVLLRRLIAKVRARGQAVSSA